MIFLVSAHTDQGIEKESNQDSLCVMEAETSKGRMLMAADRKSVV